MSIRHSKVNQVFTATTLSDAQKNIESVSRQRWFSALCIKAWISIANAVLTVLNFYLFRGTKKTYRDIIVYTVGTVGDNAVMLPALAAIRKEYPNAHITVITNCQTWSQEGAKGVIGPTHYKDRLIILDDHPVQRRGFRFIVKDAALQDLKCDLFVNLSPFGNRGWFGAVIREMIFAKKLGSQTAVGFRMATYSRKNIFNKVQYCFVKNEPRRSGEVLAELGLTPAEHDDLLTQDDEARKAILSKLPQSVKDTPFFVINPGAKFRSKCWPSDRFGAIAAYLGKSYNAYSIVSGTAEETGIAEDVVRSSEGYAVNLAGQTSLQELTELLRLAMGCVTNDTGTMHMASMVGIPTVAIFSLRFSPTHWLPLAKQQNIIALFSTPDCMYCYNDFCENPICLTQIESDHVIRALDRLLQSA